jgi:hypothetical protein
MIERFGGTRPLGVVGYSVCMLAIDGMLSEVLFILIEYPTSSVYTEHIRNVHLREMSSFEKCPPSRNLELVKRLRWR